MEAIVIFARILELHESLGSWVLIKWLTEAGAIVWEFTHTEGLTPTDLAVPLSIIGDGEVVDHWEGEPYLLGADDWEITLVIEPVGEPIIERVPTIPAATACPVAESAESLRTVR